MADVVRTLLSVTEGQENVLRRSAIWEILMFKKKTTSNRKVTFIFINDSLSSEDLEDV